jgi:hypothetical protein
MAKADTEIALDVTRALAIARKHLEPYDMQQIFKDFSIELTVVTREAFLLGVAFTMVAQT